MRLRITRIIGMLIAGLLATPLGAYAGQPKDVPRIGILCSLSCGTPPLELFEEGKALLEGLARHGYVDGQNIAIDYRAAGGAGELSRLVAKLTSAKVDIILAVGDPAAALAAARAAQTIPILTVGRTDAVQLGLVRSLARPGGNITGVTVPYTESVAKQMELLKEAVPGVSRMAVLWNPANTLHRRAIKDIDAAASFLGVKLQILEARSPGDFESAVTASAKRGAGAMLALWDPLFAARQGRLTMLALQRRLPSMSQERSFVTAAGLLSYGSNIPEMYRRAAYYVDRILRGAKPADLPAEQPTRFHLAINLTTAKALGLTIPQSVLIRADLVGLKVDILVVAGVNATRAAQQATTTIPIVVGFASDLVGTGLVASLAKPGGNITGSTEISQDVSGKRLELLKGAVPKASRVAVVWYPQRGSSDEEEVRQTETAARQLGVKVQPVEVRDPDEFQGAYAAMTKQQANAVIIIRGSFTSFHRKQLLQLEAKHRLPTMCEPAEWARDGCLMSYGPDDVHLMRRAAKYVDKILKGAKPADLPVEQPTKFELVINLKTAKALGLTVPQSVLIRADEVIR